MTDNTSGIRPTEFKCLILPDPVSETFAGSSLIKPVETAEKEKFATTEGLLVAVSPLAFGYVSREDWDNVHANPPPLGSRVIYTKYGGFRVKGRDGKDYLLIADKDIHATVED